MRPVVFEIANEVANKVGGIHAVLTSKAGLMRKHFSQYYTIGPYIHEKSALEFEEVRNHPFNKIFRELGDAGVKCVCGKWMTADKANCILVDPINLYSRVNELKTDLWNQFRVDSLFAWDYFNESVVWSTAAGMLLENLLKHEQFADHEIICHFHEWISGAGMLYLRNKNVPAALIFTTHATTFGRTLAESGVDLIKEVAEGLKKNQTVSEERAKSYGVQAAHTMEKACAEAADAFTAVSHTTADEAKYILGKYPDVVTPNGLPVDQYPSMEELSIYHKEFKRRLSHFILAYFSPYYDIDPEENLYLFTSGRNEFHNKGFDLLIDALGKLNERLKSEKSVRGAIFFFWVPAKTTERSIEVLENLALFEAVEGEVIDNLDEIREHIIASVCRGKLPTNSKLFDEPFLGDMRKMILKMRAKRGRTPPISAFVVDDPNDQILRALVEHGLLNREEDKVKVIYYSSYLSPTDGLLNLNYKEAVMACHLGVFPSYYEPWGYTPLETAALGVPAVTTDLSGFGKFLQEQVPQNNIAITVLKRGSLGYDKAVEQLVDRMYNLLKAPKISRVREKIEAKRISELADWRQLIKNYIEAYYSGLKKCWQRTK